MRLDMKEKENSTVQLAFLFSFVESVFSGISGNRAWWREGQRYTTIQPPVGWKLCPDQTPPEPKQKTLRLCCSCCACLPASLLSFSFSLPFLAHPPPYICPTFPLFYFLPSFSPLLLFAVSVPHQYLITLILFMQETNTCTHIVSSLPVIFSLRLLCFYLFFSQAHMRQDNEANCPHLAVVNNSFNKSFLLSQPWRFESLSGYRSNCQHLNSLGALCKHYTMIRSGICSPIVEYFCSQEIYHSPRRDSRERYLIILIYCKPLTARKCSNCIVISNCQHMSVKNGLKMASQTLLACFMFMPEIAVETFFWIKFRLPVPRLPLSRRRSIELESQVRCDKKKNWSDLVAWFLSWSTFSQINIHRPQAFMEELAYFVIIRCELTHNGLFVLLSQEKACVLLLRVR